MRESGVLSLRAAMLSLVLLAGCDRERTVLVDGVPRDFVVSMRVNGAEVPVGWRRDRVRARIAAPAEATVTLWVTGPCGLVELPIRRLEYVHENEVYVLDEPVDARHVLVDVRGAAGRALSIGALVLDLPAGAQRAVRIPAATCTDGAVIRAGGETIGQLPSDPHAEVLVDLDGSHCYRVRAEELAPVILAGLPGPESTPIVTHLTTARVHDLSPVHVDFAFQEIPERVDPDEIGRFDDRHVFTSLVAEDCAPAPER